MCKRWQEYLEDNKCVQHWTTEFFFLERNFKVINVKKALFTEKCKIKYKIESGLKQKRFNRNFLWIPLWTNF